MQFLQYWWLRLKEAVSKARVRTDGIVFAAVLLVGLAHLLWVKIPVDTTVWWICLAVFGTWFVLEICFISPYRHAQRLLAEIQTKDAELADRRMRKEVLEQIASRLDVVQKLERVCNDPHQTPPTESVSEWEVGTCVYLADNVGKAAESYFTSEVGVPPEPICRFAAPRSELLRRLHYRSYQLHRIFEKLTVDIHSFG
jgi:hypothetical protein